MATLLRTCHVGAPTLPVTPGANAASTLRAHPHAFPAPTGDCDAIGPRPFTASPMGWCGSGVARVTVGDGRSSQRPAGAALMAMYSIQASGTSQDPAYEDWVLHSSRSGWVFPSAVSGLCRLSVHFACS
jgi:hypothetical protein